MPTSVGSLPCSGFSSVLEGLVNLHSLRKTLNVELANFDGLHFFRIDKAQRFMGSKTWPALANCWTRLARFTAGPKTSSDSRSLRRCLLPLEVSMAGWHTRSSRHAGSPVRPMPHQSRFRICTACRRPSVSRPGRGVFPPRVTRIDDAVEPVPARPSRGGCQLCAR